MAHYLEFKNITKEFPGVKALDSVSFSVDKGSVHGLLGENGAGKSTLLKTLSGVHQPTGGEIYIDGQKKVFNSTRDSLDAGVSIIYQELNLVPEMTVSENLMLGHLPKKNPFIDKKKLREIAERKIEELAEDIDPNTKIKDLSIGQRQMIEIGKALLQNSRIIAFDEPTSSLSQREVEHLFEIIRGLKKQGYAIIYISHRMEEIFELCDSVTVLRDGQKIETFNNMEEVTHDLLVKRMVGREITDIYGYEPREQGEVIFEVDDIYGEGLSEKVNFSVAAGEIVGFFGLVGAGRSELLKLVYGAKPVESGKVKVHGKEVKVDSPSAAIKGGVSLLPEDRKDEGIIPVRSVNENINISCRRHILKSNLFLDKEKEQENTEYYIDKLGIKTPSGEQLIGNLSGGNQQKAILARWLSEKIDIFLMDEPTRGIDVGAKYEIYKIMYQLAKEGKGVVFVSSDLPEVLGVADRVIVMRDGKVIGSLSREEANDEKVLSMALPTK
jgi:L-arabinose transport system ATP-binding protein